MKLGKLQAAVLFGIRTRVIMEFPSEVSVDENTTTKPSSSEEKTSPKTRTHQQYVVTVKSVFKTRNFLKTFFYDDTLIQLSSFILKMISDFTMC